MISLATPNVTATLEPDNSPSGTSLKKPEIRRLDDGAEFVPSVCYKDDESCRLDGPDTEGAII